MSADSSEERPVEDTGDAEDDVERAAFIARRAERERRAVEDGGPVLSSERLAEINRRRKTPLEDMVPHEEMIRMLEERLAAEAGEED